MEEPNGLKELLKKYYPNIQILDVAKESGQRVVYFCRFKKDSSQFAKWNNWGDVVVKISPCLSPATYAYLQREIDFLQSIDSSYFPKLYHFTILSEDPDTEVRIEPKLFMTIEERIFATPLSAITDSFKTEAKLIQLLIKLLRALRLLWLHERQFVHRDLKPDNILIRPSGEVVIIDLGIVRETGADGETNTKLPFGPMTFQYASPEQAVNDKRNITFKSDIFSLGTISYELLTGKNPFLTGSAMTIEMLLERIVNFAPQDLYSLGVVSLKFSQILSRMMEKAPYKRYRTVDQLEQELQSIIQEQPKGKK